MPTLRVVFTAAAALLLSACGSSSSSGQAPGATGQGGTDAAGGSAAAGTSSTGGSAGASGSTGAGAGGAAAGAGGGAAGKGGAGGAMACNVGDPPAGVPTIKGKFIQGDGTPASSPPKMTGGDVTGTWVFDSLVIYLPPSTKGLVDPAMSSVSAVAWSILGADGSYKLSTHVESTIVTLIGPMSSTTDSQSVGTYVTMGATLTPMTTCSTSNNNATLEFTRTGSTGQFLVHTQAMGNPIDLLLGGKVQ